MTTIGQSCESNLYIWKIILNKSMLSLNILKSVYTAEYKPNWFVLFLHKIVHFAKRCILSFIYTAKIRFMLGVEIWILCILVNENSWNYIRKFFFVGNNPFTFGKIWQNTHHFEGKFYIIHDTFFCICCMLYI